MHTQPHPQWSLNLIVAAVMWSLFVHLGPATASANHDGIVNLTSAAAGTVNPANWTFFMETMGNDATWNSPIGQNVETGFAHYAFTYQITQLDVDVATFLGIVTLDRNQLVGLGLVAPRASPAVTRCRGRCRSRSRTRRSTNRVCWRRTSSSVWPPTAGDPRRSRTWYSGMCPCSAPSRPCALVGM